MTLLSKRVQKAKALRITTTSGKWNTWGSKDDGYRITLKSGDKEIVTPDGYLTIKVFRTDCQKLVFTPGKFDCDHVSCKGNTQHTACYHVLGAIWKSFKDVGSQVTFYQTFRDADRALTFGGFLAKVENNNGRGNVWCVVRKKPGTPEIRKISVLPASKNIELMRGNEYDEVID